jgi:hypothetical protein
MSILPQPEKVETTTTTQYNSQLFFRIYLPKTKTYSGKVCWRITDILPELKDRFDPRNLEGTATISFNEIRIIVRINDDIKSPNYVSNRFGKHDPSACRISVYDLGETLLTSKVATPWVVSEFITVEDVKWSIKSQFRDNKVSYFEGESATFLINSLNNVVGESMIPINTVLPFRIVGSIDTANILNLNLPKPTVVFRKSPDYKAPGSVSGITLSFKENPATLEGAKTCKIQVFPPGTDMSNIPSDLEPFIESPEITINDVVRTIDISSDRTTLMLGEEVKFNIVTTGVDNNTKLFYKIGGTVTTSDYSNVQIGTIIINDNKATLSIKTRDSLSKSGNKTLNVSIWSKTVISSSGTSTTDPWVTSDDVTVSPPVRTIKIEPPSNVSNNTIYEGTVNSFNIVTTFVPDGTRLVYKVEGDFDPTKTSFRSTQGLTGSVIISKNKGSLSVYFNDTSAEESNRTFSISIWEVGVTSSTIGSNQPWVTSDTYSVKEVVRTISVKTYLGSSTTEITEITEGGAVANFRMVTQGVPNGTKLAWNITGTASATLDYNYQSGLVSITDNKGYINVSAQPDYVTDDGEYIQFNVYKIGVALADVSTNTPWASSEQIYIKDYLRSLTITPSATSVKENETVYFNIVTTGFLTDNTFPYKLVGTRFSSNGYIGKFTPYKGKTRIPYTPAFDDKAEQNQNVKMLVYKPGENPATATPWVESDTISITDIERTLEITYYNGSTKEPQSVTKLDFIVLKAFTTLIPDNTVMMAAMFSSNSSEPIIEKRRVSKGICSFGFTIPDDLIEGTNQWIKFAVYQYNVVEYNSSLVPWKDTAQIELRDVSRTISVKVTQNGVESSSMSEGSNALFRITTSNVPDNTKLAYKITGVSTSDISVPLTGEIKITKSYGGLYIDLLSDGNMEGNETLTLNIYKKGVALADIANYSPWVSTSIRINLNFS